MRRAVDALVTGFTRSPALLARSLAPLCRLRQEGAIRAIRCVTWDSADLDPLVAPLAALEGVALTRVPQPDVQGSANQRGVVYQIENLKAALALVPDDALILKWRPDVVARTAFLRGKIADFAHTSRVPPRDCLGVTMPAPVFAGRLWIPWADSNSPFFFEDAVFLGTRRDVEMLTALPTPADREVLGDAACGSYAHVVRFAKPFVRAYPLFENYLKRFFYFRHDLEYRQRLVPRMVAHGFFWHMLIAHAWILRTQFHVDIGRPGDLAFYANTVNRDADWARFETLRVSSPYDNSAAWCATTRAGHALPSVCRAFGRLMDDAWQEALFVAEVPDLPRATLAALMANVAACGDDRLAGIEAAFYRGVDSVYRAGRHARLAG